MIPIHKVFADIADFLSIPGSTHISLPTMADFSPVTNSLSTSTEANISTIRQIDMQTGFELTGLVLGIIPIFRTTSNELGWLVGHSQTTLSNSKSHDKLEDFLTNLHYELSLLQMSVEKLINELATLHVDEREALKTGSNRRLWTDQRVSRAIQDRLGVGYDTFQTQITKLLENLEKLVHKDDIGARSSTVRITLM
jgi:hypothetical protein